MHRLSGMIGTAIIAIALSFGPLSALSIREFSDLRGWEKDDHQAALEAFRNTCEKSRYVQLRTLCKIAHQDIDAKPFFELFFKPVLVSKPGKVVYTGYFEPVLRGSLFPTSRFSVPIYAKPKGLAMGSSAVTRMNIVERGILAGRGLELAYVENEVDLFYAQIQGSVSIELQDGKLMRLGYGGYNGHPYNSAGQWLVERGYIKAHQASQKFIKNWVEKNPGIGRRALTQSPGYVFFRSIGKRGNNGPLGALSKPLTALRSIAVDPDHYMMGGLYWVEKRGKTPLQRLMVAQDTGSAIQSVNRIDLFFGTGKEAGDLAQSVKDPGSIYALMPIDTFYALYEERKER